LLKRGDEVVVVDEVNDYYDPSIKQENLDILRKYGDKCRIHITDICDKAKLRSIFEEEKGFDAICHLAARAGVRPSIENPFIYVHSNLEGTVVLLELAREFKVTNFVFASSSSVYGNSLKVPFSEEDRVDNPVSQYAATKKSGELICHTYHHLYGMNIACLRFFTVYGPRGRPDMAPFKFVDSIYKGETIKQFGDGSSRRDYTFVEDIVSGVVASIDKPQGYQIYNLGRGDTVILKDFIALIEELVGKKARIEILPEQPGDVQATFADTSKAQRQLDYKPNYSIREGMKKTVEWYVSKYGTK
jgi:UDP-glucuronate 4-epimerase